MRNRTFMRQIILDTETTGLEPAQGHRVIEFAGLEMVDRKLTGNSCHLYIHPEREIDPDAERVHGISLDFLSDKPKFKQVADELISFIRDAELIIHNAPFDVAFLNAEFTRLDIPPVDILCAGVIDTLVMARESFPGKRNNLDALCDRFDIDRSNRTLHGALVDCELLSEVYLSLTRGQESLSMEMDISSGEGQQLAMIDFERKPLKLLRASEDELNAHEAYLDALSAAGDCVWRRDESR